MTLAGQQHASRERHFDQVPLQPRSEFPRLATTDRSPDHEEASARATIWSSAFDLPQAAEVEALVLNWRQGSVLFANLHAQHRDSGSALRHFGLIHWDAGDLDRARDAFTAGLALDAGNGLLWRDLAFVLQASGQTVSALACIRRSLDVAPAEARSWLMLASLLSRQGDQAEAETAFHKAIERDWMIPEVHFGLALLLFGQRRFEEAAASLRATVALDPANATAIVCCGHALYMCGDFAEAAATFETGAALAPLDIDARRRFARARTFETMLAGRVAEALDAYPGLAGDASEDLATLLYTAFSLFSAFGHRDAAIEIGRLRLASDPADPIQRYLLGALDGTPHASAPLDYLEHYFDRFAPEFDEKLVDLLAYRVPQHLQALVVRHRARFDAILDLGCGTGLAAQPFAPLGGSVTGVDLSARMLAEAEKCGRYTALVKAEALAFLAAHPRAFDLIVAADVLIYSGDLRPILAGIAGALRPDGLVALNLETTDQADIHLLPSGRFAHRPSAVLPLIEGDFIVLDDVSQVLRLEGRAPVDGRLMVLQRKEPESASE